MHEVTITRQDDGRKGRYVARIDGIEGEAEITFTRLGSVPTTRARPAE